MTPPPRPPAPGDGRGADLGIEADYGPEVLAVLDAWAPPEPRDRQRSDRRVAWPRRSVVGVVVAGWAFGLREVLEPDRDEPLVIEVDADQGSDDQRIRLLLDRDDPARSRCLVRRGAEASPVTSASPSGPVPATAGVTDVHQIRTNTRK